MTNIRLERYDSAVVAYTHAIDINTDNRDYWFNRAYCLYQVGDKNTSLSQLDYNSETLAILDAALQLRSDVIAGRKPRQQASNTKNPQFYQLPRLQDDNRNKPTLMRNHMLTDLPK